MIMAAYLGNVRCLFQARRHVVLPLTLQGMVAGAAKG
jgi:hypothetical protein